jgi:hypothetical protein
MYAVEPSQHRPGLLVELLSGGVVRQRRGKVRPEGRLDQPRQAPRPLVVPVRVHVHRRLLPEVVRGVQIRPPVLLTQVGEDSGALVNDEAIFAAAAAVVVAENRDLRRTTPGEGPEVFARAPGLLVRAPRNDELDLEPHALLKERPRHGAERLGERDPVQSELRHDFIYGSCPTTSSASCREAVCQIGQSASRLVRHNDVRMPTSNF